MLVIRLFRIGKKNQPSFKIVVTDKRKPTRAGRFVEEVGFWNPRGKEKILKKDRILHWLSVGAKPSPTVHNLLVKEKIIEGKKIPKHKKPEKKEEKKPEEEKPAQEKKEEKVSKKTPETPKAPESVPEKAPEKTSEVREKKSETPEKKT